MHFNPFPLATLCLVVATASAESTVPPPASAYIQRIVVDPDQPDTLYAASPGSGLYRSLNGGDSWSSIAPNKDLRHFNAVAIDPSDSSRLFTGGKDSGIWYSPDRGTHWEPIGLEGESILDLALDPAKPERIFVLVPDGVYRSDGALSGAWEQVFDYPAFLDQNRRSAWPPDTWQMTRFQGITVDPHDPRIITIGARWEGGYHLSADGGQTWTHEKVGPIFRRPDRIAFDPDGPAIRYAATHHQGVFKSYNHGQSWVSSSRGIEPQKRTPTYGAVLVSGLAFDPTDARIIYSGSDYSNWKSTDGGQSWEELGLTLTCEFARSFAVAPGNPSTVYAGTNVGIYRSTDQGATWEPCNRGLPERQILETCLATIDGESYEYAVARGRPTVFRRSVTRNTDWVSMSWMLYEDAHAITFDAAEGVLTIETDKGTRRSFDGGFRWDVEPTVYEDRPSILPPAPGAIEEPVSGDGRLIPIMITGAPEPDDRLVNPLYQRPPYISIQIVPCGYPLDGSIPAWSGRWDHQLSGTIQIPEAILQSAEHLLLYVEVRDFQYGTLTGQTPFDPAPDTPIKVAVTAN